MAKCGEVGRSGAAWAKVVCRRPKWAEVGRSVAKLVQSWFKVGSKWFELVQSRSIWFNMVQSGSKWFKVVQSGLKWFKVIQSGSKWVKVGRSGAKCGKVQGKVAK